jgi:hypothetical protein
MGFHLLSALNDDGTWKDDIADRELLKAIDHCYVATLDSLSYMTHYLLGVCQRFADSYFGHDEVYRVIPDYNNHLAEMQKIRDDYVDIEKISDTRDHFDTDKKIRDVEETAQRTLRDCGRLAQIRDIFMTASPQIDALIVKRKAESWLNKIIAPTVVGLLVALIMWLAKR